MTFSRAVRKGIRLWVWKIKTEFFPSNTFQVESRQPPFIGDGCAINDYFAVRRLIDQADAGKKGGFPDQTGRVLRPVPLV